MASVNGSALLSAEIRMPRIGPWRADIQVDDEADLSSGVEIEIDGVVFVGTALPGRFGVNGTRYQARVVGGAGGLSTELNAKSYESPSGVRIGSIVQDILREAGETISGAADAATLSRKLPRWHRDSGPASHAITYLAEKASFDWRILGDGTVWVGAATWPEATVEHVLEDEDWTNGILTIAPTAPSLTAGVTFRGQRAEQVTHCIDNEGALRTQIHARTLRGALFDALGRIRREIDYSRLYRCRVSRQNSDLTLQLVPDDDIMKGRGLDKVPARLGLPGFVVRVQSGVRCMLGFTNGDPSQPYACNFDQDGNASLISVEFMKNGLSAPIARVGDPVYAVIPYTPAPQPGAFVPFPITAAIQAGNPGFKA